MKFSVAKNTYIKVAALLLTVLLWFGICSCQSRIFVDPHAGMVEVPDGTGGTIWVKLYDDVPVSAFSAEDFSADGTYIEYSGTQYSALRGIDVSEHQGDIDWQAVRDDGIEFAIIRVGYRGYSEGQLFEDAYFRKNIEGAQANGIEVGVYFFSQAVNTEEASEEASFMLKTLEGYNLDLPVFFDWEQVSGVGETRVDTMDSSTLTDCALAFCSVIESAGKDAGVYFYRSLGYYDYELNRLTNLSFWVGAPAQAPDFYYAHSMWQYSFTGTVDGIEGGTDLNLLFEELPVGSSSPTPSIVPGGLMAPEVTMPSPTE
ncbi:MAG: glycoside hydrolase [Clostridia bacterium]|nr:glycoside hydrolase [Clostridia bacterium]